MQSEKQLIIKYWSKTNAFYYAKLVDKYQVSTLSQEEANKLINSSFWTHVGNKPVSVKSRAMIEKTYAYMPLT